MVDLHGNGQCAGTAGTVIGQNTHGVVGHCSKDPAVQHLIGTEHPGQNPVADGQRHRLGVTLDEFRLHGAVETGDGVYSLNDFLNSLCRCV